MATKTTKGAVPNYKIGDLVMLRGYKGIWVIRAIDTIFDSFGALKRGVQITPGEYDWGGYMCYAESHMISLYES